MTSLNIYTPGTDKIYPSSGSSAHQMSTFGDYSSRGIHFRLKERDH